MATGYGMGVWGQIIDRARQLPGQPKDVVSSLGGGVILPQCLTLTTFVRIALWLYFSP
jgi:hypothetical protein